MMAAIHTETDDQSGSIAVELDSYPDIVLGKILSFLDYKDLGRCCLVNRRLNDAVHSELIWKRMCQDHWLQYHRPKECTWKEHFNHWYKDFGRYIHIYPTIRRAWDKIEAFTKSNLPILYQDLKGGITDIKLDTLERKHKVKYPDDLRCSYRIHNGQKAADGSMVPGLLGSLGLYHIYFNETLCPVSVTYQYLDNPEEFCDIVMLSYCYRTKLAQLMSLSEMGGHVPGQVFYQVPDESVLNSFSGGGIFMEDKFIVANSFTQWLTNHAENLEKNIYPIVQGCIYKFYHEPECLATSHDVNVSVSTAFLPNMSSVHPPNFVHAYRITLSMPADAPQSASCQLVSRHWDISDESGYEDSIDGPGVIGEFPVMKPGSTFSWESSTSFQSTHGYMTGHFVMRNLNTNEHINVTCPRFHMKCLPYQKWEERKEIVLQRKKQQKEQGLPHTKDVVELEMEERQNNCGFTEDDAHELLSYGIKPWEEDAYDFLEQLQRARDEDQEDYDDE